MPVIHLLSQNTIDKIAAGEVVERPLSVVKELTENAIDAGAAAITVEIKDGGISLIRVTDNGCGIEKEQVRKAFLRHATSKITSIEDLDYVKSLGFRGEALSSIAAVAQVEVITKIKEDLTGVRFQIAGGCEEELEEVGAPDGTTFLVHNLFFNTPVRKKFLKQPQTEGSYVADMMEHLALSRPDIAIKFIQNGQIKFHTSGNGNLKEVIYRIYGKDVTGALLPFTYEDNGLSISGFLGKPELNRSNRNFETYFVNGRYVRNDILTKAVEEGYKAYLMQHKFPFFVLHFTMAPDMLDVNVHPAKMEIRLIRGSELYEQISKAVAVKLGERELIPDIKLTEEEKEPKQVPKTPEPFEIRRSAMVMEERGEYRTAAATKELPREPKAGELLQKVVQNRVIGNENAVDIAGNEGIHANVIKAKDHILVEKPSQLNLFEEKFLTREAKNEYRILGQIFDTYWLVAFKDKLFIVDQHAAHEKVKYERLVKELEEKKISSQMLNPPVILTLSGREETLVFEYRSYFKELGFEIEDFGGSSVAVRSMPVDLYGCDEKELFTDILDELSENEAKGTPAVILHKLASMACKSAVKGNNKLDQKEMETLLEELFTLDNPYHCPHGRPTIISMSKYEIEKKFKRII
ncbi:MAG: DNA mismatch repair endonuclease MutL [Lachnospiraceae bacterium]|nr:DNA mismatch repair endonuclease MutL [Lachnospiraceae bacterium]GFI01343.1 DNA mismatch repair protein MutL [Lachnospiraceae bacterium]